jgi:lipopolysaccharide biosynthesis regulator YciM
VNTGLARIYDFRNELDKAKIQIRKTIGLDSGYAEAHFTEGMIYYKTKEYEKAVRSLKKAIELSGRRPVMLGMLGAVYTKLEKTNEAKTLLAELDLPPMNNDKLYAVMTIKGALGQSEEFFKDLQKLLNEKYGILIYMRVSRDFFKEHNDPRYHEILKKIGLE